jgi:hypothetical protein
MTSNKESGRMIAWRGVIGIAVAALLASLLAACQPSVQQQTIYYGTGSYTVGIYDDPNMNRAPPGM